MKKLLLGILAGLFVAGVLFVAANWNMVKEEWAKAATRRQARKADEKENW